MKKTILTRTVRQPSGKDDYELSLYAASERKQFSESEEFVIRLGAPDIGLMPIFRGNPDDALNFLRELRKTIDAVIDVSDPFDGEVR